jgi:ATP-binding protein involved in chromosome partitioning
MLSEDALSQVSTIIAVASGKGGVGKSTVTSNLAYALSSMGHQVGVLDADIYGPSQPLILGNSESPRGEAGLIFPVERKGIKFISIGSLTSADKPTIMRAPMAVNAITQFLKGVRWGKLDFLLIDLPPGTGDIQLSIAQKISLSGIIIVTTPQKLASEIARKGLLMFEALNVPVLGVVENMSGFTCEHCHHVTAPFKKGGGRDIAKRSGVRFLGEIPLDPAIMLSADEGEDPADPGIFLSLAENFLESLSISREEALKTEPTKIENDGSNIRISWRDGSFTEADAYTLRTLCPCAMCVDEKSGERILRPQDIPLSIKARNVQKVGRYGVMIEFSDGHSHGIYRLSELRKFSHPEESAISL